MGEAAVYIRGAVKNYGRHIKVLTNFNMSVSTGSIYALLGASGCGKTTLLNCIVGRQKLNSGELRVLGGTPGNRNSGVPGCRVGYMPQDVALLGEFTVKGVIFYFGWLFNMSNKELEERFTFLAQLLELPPEGMYISELSGGQQRRVSFAAALVHRAELLILDEPTVGLDPMLRQTVWEYLTKLSEEQNTTVIITTHYIEEANQAHKIGLMRQGILLAEDTPQNLLALHKCSSMEQVFLKLSIKQSHSDPTGSGVMVHGEENRAGSLELQAVSHATQEMDVPEKCNKTRVCQGSSLSRMKALVVKNSITVLRSPTVLWFVSALPLLQVALFYLAIGGHPKGLKFAVVNDELGNYSDCAQFIGDSYTTNYSCHFSGLSCLFLSRINDSVAKKEYYRSRESAIDAVRAGEAIGSIFFSSNFSSALEARIEEGRYATPGTVRSSEVDYHMDMSNQVVGIKMQAMMYEEFRLMAEDMAQGCNMSTKAAHIPMQFNEPVYGIKYPEYQDYIAPRYILSIVYFLSTTLTTTVVITDRTEGLWHRNIVAGVTLTETLCGHILCQLACVVMYTAEAVLISLLLFHLRCEGNIGLVCLMVFLQGVSGMTYGLLLSALCTSYTMAVFLAVGSLMPFICLCGVVWPIEGMPYLLKIVSYFMPCTMANLSFASILEKGWPFWHPQVFSGFLVTIAWIVAQFLISLFVLRV